MFRTGLLILTRPLPVLGDSISPLLTEVAKIVGATLYVHIQPNTTRDNKVFTISQTPYTQELRTFITQLYICSASVCNHLNVNILLGHISNKSCFPWDVNYRIKPNCDVILFDDDHWLGKDNTTRTSLLENISKKFQPDCRFKPAIEVVNVDQCHNESAGLLSQSNGPSGGPSSLISSFNNTVLGGTFDHIHTGHKILLGEGCLLADKRLTVGVTDGDMNNKKTLPELIQPLQSRLESVKTFIQEVRPNICPNVVPIYDAFGPTITDADLQCIILSQETRKGGQMVNEERQKKGFPQMEEFVIDLVEDQQHDEYEENKISSSSFRKRLLGTMINTPQKKKNLMSVPYVIGLTGGIASGKSAICKRLEGLGAASIDCDKLGHQVYMKGLPAYNRLVEVFGSSIVGEDEEINRRALGPIVFSDPEKLKMLNSIVWPEISKLAEETIQQFRLEGMEVVVLEAALLLDAGWDKLVHEVWTTIIPRQEAIKRMVDRNKFTEEEASKRLDSQLTNQERVNRSNVVLCTLWDYKYTQQQVEHAWLLLSNRRAVLNKL
ncbi:bifunctional coenzyme A synthase-like isoform X2 [Mizuhopecten yessoensis]|uniref:Bifunctional coenzyme A synthase n=2 Tax=Mizuhopecten yessoensis TaxID=6573 RepID=A0A210Q5U8_MIZYE|nr:bifunctional coenzyme A synthase-like isoform X2 [Mizuhopecten yessoensis]OWF44110.1 Bifunctional coenzyme A synthase [Mizuhopecten yessoensis]